MGKRQKHGDINLAKHFLSSDISAIHLAAASGDPETLRLFITNQQFDPLVRCHGATSLHFVVASRPPHSLPSDPHDEPIIIYVPNSIMKMEDFGDVDSFEKAKVKGAKNPSYKGREACISILVQGKHCKPRKALMKLAMRSPLWLLWLPLHLMWVLCNHLLVM